MDYTPEPYDDDNIFAKILREEIPAFRVYEDTETLVFLDIMPRVDGHMLVIPKTPCRNMLDASEGQMAACLSTTQRVSRALLGDPYGADGITLQQFNEPAGGQEVYHLHFHILPRRAGDSLRPPGQQADMGDLKTEAEKIRAAIEAA
ncbi:MAG: HIT family protein [Pseudomonadota bacterium]